LFGNTEKSARRTELVVILTPRVISNDADVISVTEDFRSRLKNLDTRF
jgi:general secretion pathway protein D